MAAFVALLPSCEIACADVEAGHVGGHLGRILHAGDLHGAASRSGSSRTDPAASRAANRTSPPAS
jgi:hypothetical protein